eukprot:3533352-Alexandrium_andersonii.AAC.1
MITASGDSSCRCEPETLVFAGGGTHSPPGTGRRELGPRQGRGPRGVIQTPSARKPDISIGSLLAPT